jgi:hypothetical protein
MRRNGVYFHWRDSSRVLRYRTGVSLHGHTMHSEECLSFLPRYLRQIPGVSAYLWLRERLTAGPIDFSRAYWTPPLNPAAALRIERTQIASLGLRPLVSLTDHDDIQAATGLALVEPSHIVPTSVEWTVPYLGSILHLGVHNLPPINAAEWMRAMADYTVRPNERALPGILLGLAEIPGTLTVLNHPFWLEEGVREADHHVALARFLPDCAAALHAFELNATRPLKENSAAMGLARAWSLPVVSGGDRHACEPGGCINLTDAETFSEFAEEVRAGHGEILFMPHYREPLFLRVLEMCWDILKPYPECAGRERWLDRVFYRGDGEAPRPLSAVWRETSPWSLSVATSILQALATAKPGLAALLRENSEATL